MTGVSLQINLDSVAAQSRVDAIARGLADTLPLMDAIGVVLVDGTVRRFEQGVDPEGRPWLPSIRARMTNGPTMIDSGRLVGSITHQATADEVRVGSNVTYAAIHQTGGTITPKSAGALRFEIPGVGFVTVGRVTIPPRPFLGVDAEDRAEIDNQLRLFVEEVVEP